MKQISIGLLLYSALLFGDTETEIKNQHINNLPMIELIPSTSTLQ